MSLLGPSVEPEVARAYGLTSRQYSELERDISDALKVGKTDEESDAEDADQVEQRPLNWRRAE